MNTSRKLYFSFGLLCVFLLVSQGVTALEPKDADDYRDVETMVLTQGYPFESHAVVTADGYILNAWRIRHGKKSCNAKTGPPVFLQHGLVDYGFTWFFHNTPETSLAYMLADLGYDVWIGNSRGAKYSRNSLKYPSNPPNDSDYWKFTWDEMASYDMPAHLEYVTKYTGYEKVHWVGHSQGTTQMFAGFTENTNIQNMLASFTAMGPVLNVGHITAPAEKLLAPLHGAEVLEFLGLEVFINPPLFNTFAPSLCRAFPQFCMDIGDLALGPNPKIDLERIQVMAGHELGGTSMFNLQHWLQNVRGNRVEKMDLGKEGNMKKYGQATVPLYDTSKLQDFSIPIYLIRGANDALADAEDVAMLREWLPKETVKFYEVPDYGHMGYMWAIDCYDTVFSKVVEFVKENTTDGSSLNVCPENALLKFLSGEQIQRDLIDFLRFGNRILIILL